MAAAAVLRHVDLLPCMVQFQGGGYPDMRALNAYVREHGRSVLYLTQKVSVSTYNLQLASILVGFRDLFAPWLAFHGLSRVARLISSSSNMGAFVVVSAIYAGDAAILQLYCQQIQLPPSYPLVDIAAWADQLDALCLVHTYGATGTTNAMDVAARDGHEAILAFLHEHRQDGCTRAAMNLAARFNHLQVVSYLQVHRTEGCSSDALVWAATAGHLAMVQFLFEHYSDTITTPLAMDGASQNGHLDVVRFLDAQGQTCTTDAVDHASLNGHLNVVTFLLQNRPEGATTRAMSYAAASGHLEVVQFLRQANVPASMRTAMLNARKNGHHNIVQYLCEADPSVVGQLGNLGINV
ncbi:hypothetical protein H310_10394 [Aphanomyces invadans]|uniref:Uncharacterized protein n=1 Tax=Aphanomyces invadans TaxID=157072 RepID=A0A024TPX9_9STRA|nr:hypothetical protein H310_10394 [Aphanomyces invadans]ETV96200.1 hypothetical protein H310_10394 [Aphanomyces invadans]|eukprot:XP_008874992.1 hypothetical protein H310_10394 [Aphanomyces invadans]